MVPHHGTGHEVSKLLQQALGIPERAKWFEVRFAAGEPVTFKGEFYAQEPEGDVEEPDNEPPEPRVGGSLDDR